MLTRALSALVLGPLVLAAVYLGGWVFKTSILAFAVIAVREWVRLVEPRRDRPVELIAYAAMAAIMGAGAVAGTIVGFVMAGACTVLLFFAAVATRAQHRWLIAFGIPYIAVACLALVWLRSDPANGLGLLLFVLLSIWATDIGAYAAGRSLGGPRLAPRISPKKTWAGLLGGMAAAAVVAGCVALVADVRMPWLAALLGALLAVIGQAGDLFESSIKRRYKVKDSGRLIPGHGGLLDRVDGLIAAAPVFAVFQGTIGTTLQWW